MSKEVTIKHTYKLKRGKEEALLALNPMLLAGEPIVSFMEDGSVNMKVGDGVHTYNELDWVKGDDTPTVPFINLGYIKLETFEQEIDNLPFDNCVGVVSIFGRNTMCYFEQWSTHANDKRQLRKYGNDKGFEERYMVQVGPSDYVWSSWSPITIDIIDTGNHFDSTRLDDVLNQLGNNQVINIGVLDGSNDVSSYNWLDGKLYTFTLKGYGEPYDGQCVAVCKLEDPGRPVHCYNLTIGTSFAIALDWGVSPRVHHVVFNFGPFGDLNTGTFGGVVNDKQNKNFEDINNNFDIDNIESAVNQLGNNQVINLGTFTSNSALSGYNWEEGKHYRFYLEGYPSGHYIGHCKYEELSGYSTPVLYLHSYMDGTDYSCELRHGNTFYPLDPYTNIYNTKGQYYKLGDVLRSTETTQVASFDELLTIANSYNYGRIFCVDIAVNLSHTTGYKVTSGRYICMRDDQAAIKSIVMCNLTKGIFYRLGTDTSYFSEENICTKQDRDIDDPNSHFTATTVEGALDELGSERIIDIGEITSSSALQGYSNWIDGRVYTIDLSNYSIGIYNICKKKEKFIYYLNSDGSGDIDKHSGKGHYIESIHTYENNCRLRIYIVSNYTYYITHDTNLEMLPLTNTVGSRPVLYSQNEAIHYLRDYINNSLIAPIQTVSTINELQRAVKTFAEKNESDYQKKPFIINLSGDFQSQYSGAGICIGTVSKLANKYNYAFYNISTNKSAYYQGIDSSVTSFNAKLDTLIVPSGLTAGEISDFLSKETNYSKDFVTIAHPIDGNSILYINMYRNNGAQQLRINCYGIEYRHVFSSKVNPWETLFEPLNIDDTLDTTSTNAIQNKVVAEAINSINDKINTIGNIDNVTLTDRKTGTLYTLYVSDGQLMLEEKSEE